MAGALPATTASICLVTIRQQIDCSIFGQFTRKGRGKGLLFAQGMGNSFFLSSCGMVLLRILTVRSKGGANVRLVMGQLVPWSFACPWGWI